MGTLSASSSDLGPNRRLEAVRATFSGRAIQTGPKEIAAPCQVDKQDRKDWKTDVGF